MNRETDFQRNVKWVIYMTAAVCALCQFILLFSEINYLSGLGIIVNLFYHAAGVACPAFILYLFINENRDKEVYGSYAIGGELFLGALVTLSIMIKYINKTKGSLAYSTAIVVFLVISIVFELLVGFLFIRYGQDKVTCVLPVLTLFVSLILRDAVLSRVDSKLHVKVNIGYDELGNIVGTSFKGSFASAWTFLHAFFFLIFVVCVIIYVDTRFLEELKDNPKDLFSKKTLFGTFTNGLIQEEKPKKKNGNIAQQMNDSNSDKPLQSVTPLQGGTAVDSTETSKENINTQNSDVLHREGAFRKCPDCGSIVPEDAGMCMTCGCPMEQRRESDMALINCPVCGGKISDKAVKCVHCGASLAETKASVLNENEKVIIQPKDEKKSLSEQDNNESAKTVGDKKSKKKVVIAAVSLLLVAVAVVMVVLFMNDKPKKSEKSTDKSTENIVDQEDNKGNDLGEAKKAYSNLKQVYSVADSMIGYESKAWKFTIYDSDGIRDLEGGASKFSQEVGLNKTEVNKAVDELAEAIKNNSPAEMQSIMTNNILAKKIFDDASYAIYLVYIVFDNKGLITDADNLLEDVKATIKQLDSDNEYYSDLKGLYTAVENYWEFTKSPSGSYATLSTNIQNYQSEIDKYISSLSFDLE